MVLAAHHMRDAGLDIVDHRGQGVEIAAILADQHGVGHGRCVDALRPAHEVVPLDALAAQLEAPVRLHARSLELRALVSRQLQRRPVIHRRPAARLGDLAFDVQLLRRLVGRIEQAHGAQLVGGLVIDAEAFGLVEGLDPGQAQPGQVLLEDGLVFLGRALKVGIVDAQDELAALAARKQPVDERGAHIADMDAASGRGSESDDRGDHGRSGPSGDGKGAFDIKSG